MNLVFYVKDTGRIVGFPFQTPTTVSEAVIRASTNSERLQILRTEMESREWDKDWIDDAIEAIEYCMCDQELALVMQ